SNARKLVVDRGAGSQQGTSGNGAPRHLAARSADWRWPSQISQLCICSYKACREGLLDQSLKIENYSISRTRPCSQLDRKFHVSFGHRQHRRCTSIAVRAVQDPRAVAEEPAGGA